MSGNDLLPFCQALADQADGKTLSDSRVFDAIRCGSYIDGVSDGFAPANALVKSSEAICFPDGVVAAVGIRPLSQVSARKTALTPS